MNICITTTLRTSKCGAKVLPRVGRTHFSYSKGDPKCPLITFRPRDVCEARVAGKGKGKGNDLKRPCQSRFLQLEGKRLGMLPAPRLIDRGVHLQLEMQKPAVFPPPCFPPSSF